MAMFHIVNEAQLIASGTVIQQRALEERLTHEIRVRRELEQRLDEKQRLLDESWYKNNFLEQRIAELERKLAERQKPTVIRRF